MRQSAGQEKSLEKLLADYYYYLTSQPIELFPLMEAKEEEEEEEKAGRARGGLSPSLCAQRTSQGSAHDLLAFAPGSRAVPRSGCTGPSLHNSESNSQRECNRVWARGANAQRAAAAAVVVVVVAVALPVLLMINEKRLLSSLCARCVRAPFTFCATVRPLSRTHARTRSLAHAQRARAAMGGEGEMLLLLLLLLPLLLPVVAAVAAHAQIVPALLSPATTFPPLYACVRLSTLAAYPAPGCSRQSEDRRGREPASKQEQCQSREASESAPLAPSWRPLPLWPDCRTVSLNTNDARSSVELVAHSANGANHEKASEQCVEYKTVLSLSFLFHKRTRARTQTHTLDSMSQRPFPLVYSDTNLARSTRPLLAACLSKLYKARRGMERARVGRCEPSQTDL